MIRHGKGKVIPLQA